MVRKPAVAGQFYPAGKEELEKDLRRMIPAEAEKRPVFGVVAPHAGYMFSGPCAGQAYSRVVIPATVIVLGVNHHGYGYRLAVDGHDFWKTPLGQVRIDDDWRQRLTEHSSLLRVDSEAGRQEHSLEVQVPFIQYLAPQSAILPITVAAFELEELLATGAEIGDHCRAAGGDVLLVASTDMSHYISALKAKELDSQAIARVTALDPEGLFRVVQEKRISMCGVGPTVILLAAARRVGAKGAELVCYTNSGEMTGDYDQVVGYASLLVF